MKLSDSADALKIKNELILNETARAKVTSSENRDFFNFVLPHSINKKAKLLYKKN